MEVFMKQLLIGTIVNTHGLQGEVKIKPKTHFISERFKKGNLISLHYEGQYIPLEIIGNRMQKDMILLKFEGYTNINDVEKWKGSNLFVDANTLPKLLEDEIYYHELYDCEVYNLNQQFLGNVIEVIETGANAVLRIQKDTTSFLVPFVKAFVKDVDRNKKTITIECVEGLL